MIWEYMVREFDVADSGKVLLLEEFLNVSGKDGWEVVTVASTVGAIHVVYLKRGTAHEIVASQPEIDGG